eukprot:jgi/Botrbrau1/11101/Bobra.0219s0010.1
MGKCVTQRGLSVKNLVVHIVYAPQTVGRKTPLSELRELFKSVSVGISRGKKPDIERTEDRQLRFNFHRCRQWFAQKPQQARWLLSFKCLF